MCGIYGYLSKVELSKNRLNEINLRMQNSLIHRGPDGNGTAFLKNGFIGNTRLAIIDLKSGNQPFISEDGAITIIQNGEIFNYKDLRLLILKNGKVLKTNSDTEVILKMYEIYGLGMLEMLQGMFAIAIYDSNIDKIYLVRDRLGEKPLFYSTNNHELIFASEVNTIININNDKTLSVNGILSYLHFNYVPQPYTIYKKIYSVNPGAYIEVSNVCNLSLNVEEHVWWEKKFFCVAPDSSVIGSIQTSLHKRLLSDVPSCVLLSGGIDSTLIALMSKESNLNLPFYTIYFDSKEDDDILNARISAKHLELNHFELNIKQKGVQWESLLMRLGQPYGDTSYISLYEICNEIGKKFKVCMTGDGADEFFAGYLSKDIIDVLTHSKLDYQSLKRLYLRNNHVFDFLGEKESGLVSDIEILNQYNDYLDELVDGAYFRFSDNEYFKHGSNLQNYLVFDMTMLLPSNNLFKTDICSMLNSVELRSPYLETDIINKFFIINDNDRISDNVNKHVLRNYLKTSIPEFGSITKRKFSFPFIEYFNSNAEYFRSVIFDLHSNLDFINIEYITDLLSMYYSDHLKHYRKIRNLLALGLWLKQSQNYKYE